jgi:hypothetical protein
MENVQLPLAVLADAIGQPLETVKSLFIDTEKTQPDADPIFFEGDKAVEKFVEIFKTEQNRFEKIGARKKGESFESEFRDAFGFNDPAQGIALVKKYVANEKASVAKLEAEMKSAKAQADELRSQVEKGQKLEGADLEKFVVNNPVFIERTTALEKEIAIRDRKLEKTIADYERRDLDKALRGKLMEALNEYSPNIAGTKEQVEAQKEIFVERQMAAADWKTVDGKILPYEKGTNNQAVNAAQRWVDLNGFILDAASKTFARNAADPSKSSPGSGAGPGKSHLPDLRGKTNDELFGILESYKGKANFKEIEELVIAHIGG